MLIEARRKTPPELADRVRFDEADAERLPYADEWFDLVTLANMIPFFDELDRVVAPGGWVVFGWSVGPETPIYVPPEVLSRELETPGLHGFVGNCGGERHRLRCPEKPCRLDLPATGVHGTETPARTPFFCRLRRSAGSRLPAAKGTVRFGRHVNRPTPRCFPAGRHLACARAEPGSGHGTQHSGLPF